MSLPLRDFLGILALSVLCNSSPASAGPEVDSFPFDTREVALDELDKRERVMEQWSSSDGRHVAYVTGVLTSGGQVKNLRVIVDGKKGPKYDGIVPGSFSPDNHHYAYLAVKKGSEFAVIDGHEGPKFENVGVETGVVFSQDGSGTAYAAMKDGRWLVVHNGQEGPGFDAVGGIVLSRDGARVAYVTRSGEDFVVVGDGVESIRHQNIVRDPVFSNDGMHVAYAAQRGDRVFVVVDGEEGPGYDDVSGIKFGPRGRQHAYTALQQGDTYAVVDGVPGPPGMGISRDGVIFSPDGTRVAYGIGEDMSRMVVDGTAGPAYSRVDRPYFSPDGRRIAYAAGRDDKWFVVVDSLEGDPYDDIYSGLIVFSPDGSRIGYVAQTGEEWCVIVDGQAGPGYRSIGGSLVFSPDGNRYAYIAVNRDGKPIVVIDDDPGPEFDSILLQTEPAPHGQQVIEQVGVVFSPDNKHVAYVAVRGESFFVVLNGAPGNSYDLIVAGGPTFNPDGSLEYLAVRSNTLYRVTCTPQPR